MISLNTPSWWNGPHFSVSLRYSTLWVPTTTQDWCSRTKWPHTSRICSRSDRRCKFRRDVGDFPRDDEESVLHCTLSPLLSSVRDYDKPSDGFFILAICFVFPGEQKKCIPWPESLNTDFVDKDEIFFKFVSFFQIHHPHAWPCSPALTKKGQRSSRNELGGPQPSIHGGDKVEAQNCSIPRNFDNIIASFFVCVDSKNVAIPLEKDAMFMLPRCGQLVCSYAIDDTPHWSTDKAAYVFS